LSAPDVAPWAPTQQRWRNRPARTRRLIGLIQSVPEISVTADVIRGENRLHIEKVLEIVAQSDTQLREYSLSLTSSPASSMQVKTTMKRFMTIAALLCPTLASASSNFDTGRLVECNAVKLCDSSGKCKTGAGIPKSQRFLNFIFLVNEESRKKPFEMMLFDTGAGGFKEVKFNKDHTVGEHDGKFANMVFKLQPSGELQVETTLKGSNLTAIGHLKCGPKN
jgi:hypothetical protein